MSTDEQNPNAVAESPAETQEVGLISAMAILSLLGLLVFNGLIAYKVPFRLTTMDSFYLIFYYHFPSALCCYVFFIWTAVCSGLYLRSERIIWDQRARVSAQVGLLGCLACVVTGAIWGKSAWNTYWVFDDPRLVSASVMCLIYSGYVMLQSQMDVPLVTTTRFL